jgi:7,8-dihydropterin-6-yl-methyl-4-(beta-D-ribofuranosyl)aminobenzene 5'-phosphate synthase
VGAEAAARTTARRRRAAEFIVRITTLVENRPSPDDPQLVAEWGLSLCVDVDGRRFLVDTGASDAFARNAVHLSIDIASIDAAILSHHHYDHGGGLRRFLELNDHAPVYLGAAPAGDPIAKLFGFVRKYVGLDKALLAAHAHRFRFVQERTEVLPGVFVLPRIGGRHPRPSGNRALFLRQDGVLAPDDFRHEVVVAIRERDALVVLTGCSHNGLVNMVETVSAEFPGTPIKAVVGGFHLAALPPFRGMAESARAVADIGQSVLDHGIEITYTGHCTGRKAFNVLRSSMGDRVREIHTGSRLEF